jgi:hypothetical protein
MTKKYVQIIFTFALTLAFSCSGVIACEVYITPLRKNFREAKQVFLGEIISVEKKTGNEIPEDFGNYGEHYNEIFKLSFKVVKAWKGVKKHAEVSLYSDDYCPCPNRKYDFQVGDKLLAFADKYKKLDTCNIYTERLANRYVEKVYDRKKYLEQAQKEMKQLDSFGFRLWARIYPF